MAKAGGIMILLQNANSFSPPGSVPENAQGGTTRHFLCFQTHTFTLAGGVA